jgi:hypothetical protein
MSLFYALEETTAAAYRLSESAKNDPKTGEGPDTQTLAPVVVCLCCSRGNPLTKHGEPFYGMRVADPLTLARRHWGDELSRCAFLDSRSLLPNIA